MEVFDSVPTIDIDGVNNSIEVNPDTGWTYSIVQNTDFMDVYMVARLRT